MAEPNLRGSIHINVNENVSLEHLQGIVAKIAGLSGCRGRGLLGIDLRLAGDPPEFQEIGKLPGVKAASFGQF